MDTSQDNEGEQPTIERTCICVFGPRVEQGKMFLTLRIEKWDERLCFYYPLDSIDNQHVMVHFLWKFAGDSNCTAKATALVDLKQSDYNRLNIHDWKFDETF